MHSTAPDVVISKQPEIARRLLSFRGRRSSRLSNHPELDARRVKEEPRLFQKAGVLDNLKVVGQFIAFSYSTITKRDAAAKIK